VYERVLYLHYNLRLQRYYPSYVHRPNDRLHVYQIVEHVYNLTDFDKKHMPDLDKYSTSTGSSGTDVSGSAFKPFSISDVASPCYVHRPNDRLHVYQIVEHVRTHTKYIDHMDTVKQLQFN
jgi:hypothetical protein